MSLREMSADELSPAQMAVARAVQEECLAHGCTCCPSLKIEGDGSDERPFEAEVNHKSGCGISYGPR